MSWKKHFQSVPDSKKLEKWLGSQQSPNQNADKRNWQSWLPEVYAGASNRIERYSQYENMDRDSEISRALDTIAEFCTQTEESSEKAFDLHFFDEASTGEIETLKESLDQWIKLNQFDKRLWRLVRNVLVYGDQFMVRDPETFKLFWIDPYKLEKIVVNEAEGKKPEEYWISNPDLNLQNLSLTSPTTPTDHYGNPHGYPGTARSGQSATSVGVQQGQMSSASRFVHSEDSIGVDATHVLHFSLSEGLDPNWPFGTSILEPIFKTFKQKELLEDAILIYRVQRAPERRVFYIDVGNMPTHRAMQHVERVKNEINQRRIPSQTGGGGSVVDSSYNPMCVDLETKIPLLDGRNLKLQDIINERNNDKQNWVYSCDPITGELAPGKITWAGVTRRNSEVIRVHLDNNNSFTCTPDHKIPVLGKGFKEAKDLTEHDSLISFERQYTTTGSPNTYDRVYDHHENKWIFTHRMVAEKANVDEYTYSSDYIGEVKNTVHHIDFDRYNNNPENLVFMNKMDHVIYHRCNIKEFWNTIDNERAEEIKDKIRAGLKRTRSQYTEEEKEELSQKMSETHKKWIREMKEKEPERYQEWRNNVGKGISRGLKTKEDRDKRAAHLGTWADNRPNQMFVFTQDMLQRLVEIVSENNSNRLETIELVHDDEKFMNLMREANQPKEGMNFKIDLERFTDSKLKKMYAQYGYKNWKDFKNKIPVYNHRITKIEYLDEPIDVGTITVDGNHEIHDYHTFAIESGIFVKNSMLEDYYFAQGCLKMDTEILLHDNTVMTLEEIAQRYQDGDMLYVKTFDQKNHNEEVGFIKWAGVTRKDAHVVEVHLSNDEVITATPDHRFILHDGSEVEAQELSNEDRLASVDNDVYVESIVPVKELYNTGDLTIESPSGSHNFALASGIYVHNSEGRGSSVETLNSGQNLGDIDDLRYFNNKLIRGLNVPSSYIPFGPEDGQQSYTDGRVTTALIQEYMFSEYCKRIQALLNGNFDREFKIFLKNKGIQIDTSLFEVKLNEPQNFAAYREIELDSQRISNWSSIADVPYMSKRFAMKRYLGLSEDEIVENERMWKEENPHKEQTSDTGQVSGDTTDDLRQLGVRPESGEDFGGPEDQMEPGPQEPDAQGGQVGGESPEGQSGQAGGPPGSEI